jgi:hypothetical protein
MWHIDPFLGSDHETNNKTTFTAREPLGKQVPAATDTHATIKVLQETVPYMVVHAEGL